MSTFTPMSLRQSISGIKTTQVPPSECDPQGQISEQTQEPKSNRLVNPKRPNSLYGFVASKTSRKESANLKPNNTRRKKQRGGYRIRRTLTKGEIKIFQHSIKIMTDNGYKPSVLISVNPPVVEGEKPNNRKRRIQREISGLAKIVNRAGKGYHSVSVYEYPNDAPLHAHILLHIPDEVRQNVQDWIERDGIWDNTSTKLRYGMNRHATPYNRNLHLSYLTKERTFSCPPVMWNKTANNSFRPRAGNAFKGKRLGLSKDLKKLIGNLDTL